MKTLLDQVLEDIGVRTLDENNVPRSPEDVTNNVMAALEKYDKETAEQILLMLAVASSIENAAQRMEERRLY